MRKFILILVLIQLLLLVGCIDTKFSKIVNIDCYKITDINTLESEDSHFYLGKSKKDGKVYFIINNVAVMNIKSFSYRRLTYLNLTFICLILILVSFNAVCHRTYQI